MRATWRRFRCPRGRGQPQRAEDDRDQSGQPLAGLASAKDPPPERSGNDQLTRLREAVHGLLATQLCSRIRANTVELDDLHTVMDSVS